jgi:hypothetical protein
VTTRGIVFVKYSFKDPSNDLGEQEYTNYTYREEEVDFSMRLFEARIIFAEQILEESIFRTCTILIEIFILLKNCCVGEHEKANN